MASVPYTLFIDQIHSNIPIIITDPGMTRFMMTLSDAVRLVLYAFEHGNNGDIFVQKAPAATIATLQLLFQSYVEARPSY